jgi:hypothetical protein
MKKSKGKGNFDILNIPGKCPFCGEEAISAYVYGIDGHIEIVIECDSCQWPPELIVERTPSTGVAIRLPNKKQAKLIKAGQMTVGRVTPESKPLAIQ